MKQILKFTNMVLFILTISNGIRSQNLDTFKCNFQGKVLKYTEQMPVFPGGELAMYDFIKANLVYPESARKDKFEGTVVAQFIIDSLGIVICPKINRYNPLNEDCAKEVLRIINLFPKWKPGKHQGINVNVNFTLPIRFILP